MCPTPHRRRRERSGIQVCLGRAPATEILKRSRIAPARAPGLAMPAAFGYCGYEVVEQTP